MVHIRVQSSPGGNTGGGVGSHDEEEETSGDNGPLTAIEALKEACATLSNQCDLVLEKLEEGAPEVKGDRERMDRLTEEDRMNEDEEEEEEEEEEE